MKKIPIDKVLHFVCGYAIAVTFYLLPISKIETSFKVALGFLLSMIVGFSKELFDREVRNKEFDVIDMKYTIAGGAIATIFLSIVLHFS